MKFVSLGNLTVIDPRYRGDPDGAVRGHCPVVIDPLSQGVLVMGYDVAREALMNRTSTRDALRFAGGRSSSDVAAIVALDDPDHSRIRKPLIATLVAWVKRSDPEILRIVDAFLDHLSDEGEEADLVAAYAEPVVANVVASLLGVEDCRRDRIVGWLLDISALFTLLPTEMERARLDMAMAGLTVFLEDAVASRVASPGSDWISDLVASSGLTPTELVINVRISILGAVLPTLNLLSTAVRLLLLNPLELRKLRTDPSLIDAVIEEALRVEPPAGSTARASHEKCRLGDMDVMPFQPTSVMIRAANHDPSVFVEPDTFVIDADRRPHLSFGAGARMCIGFSFGRRVGRMAVGRLIERFPDLRLRDPIASPEWRATPFMHGVERLPVRLFADPSALDGHRSRP